MYNYIHDSIVSYIKLCNDNHSCKELLEFTTNYFSRYYDFIIQNTFTLDYIQKLIANQFIIEIKHIDNTKFINDVTFFNTTLVGFIKFCASKNFNKINIIFIIFCDYFDLPYNLMFNNLHPKIKDNIIKRYIKLVGNLEYQKQKQKYNEQKDYVQPTLFDLING